MVGRDAEVPRRRIESDMGAKYTLSGPSLALVGGYKSLVSE
jgi:hypothetical protein